MIKVGCCGFPVAKKRYFEHLSLMEVQQTFYDPPERAVIERWARESPSSFEYTIKAWQLITHPAQSPTYKRLKMGIPEEKQHYYGFFRATDEVWAAWKRTEEVARMLRSRVIVFQTPRSFFPTDENKKNLIRFFSSIQRDFLFCLELRGWHVGEVETLCRELELIPILDPFLPGRTLGPVGYFRLHGKGGYRFKYSHEDLLQLKGILPSDRDVYVLFNNVYMFDNALEFKDLIGLS